MQANSKSPCLAVFCVLVLASLRPEPTWAQAERQPGALFRGAEPTGEVGQVLALTGSLFGGYDDDLSAVGLTDAGVVAGPVGSGTHSGLNFSLAYRPGGRNLQFSASTINTVRYYPEFSDLLPASHAATVALRARMTPRTSASMQLVSAYSPSFAVAPISAPVTTAGDFQALPARHRDYAISTVTYDANLGFDRTLSSRSSLSARYGQRYTDFRSGPGNSTDQAAGVAFTNRFQRATRLGVSYNYRQSNYTSPDAEATGQLTTVQEIELTLDRDWRASRTRGTTLRLRIGPSKMQQGPGQRYTLNGGAGLDYRFGRSWTSGFSYRRGVNFLEGVAAPIPSDSGNIALRGFFGRRLSLFIDASFVTGEVGLDLRGSRYDTYFSIARTQFAISRSVAVFGEYLYHQYRFGTGAPLPEGYARTRERNGVRVGLDVAVPLLNQRVNNGSR